MFVVLKEPGTDTVVTLTTTELDVEEHPAGVVIVTLYVPETETEYVDEVCLLLIADMLAVLPHRKCCSSFHHTIRIHGVSRNVF